MIYGPFILPLFTMVSQHHMTSCKVHLPSIVHGWQKLSPSGTGALGSVLGSQHMAASLVTVVVFIAITSTTATIPCKMPPCTPLPLGLDALVVAGFLLAGFWEPACSYPLVCCLGWMALDMDGTYTSCSASAVSSVATVASLNDSAMISTSGCLDTGKPNMKGLSSIEILAGLIRKHPLLLFPLFLLRNPWSHLQ